VLQSENITQNVAGAEQLNIHIIHTLMLYTHTQYTKNSWPPRDSVWEGNTLTVTRQIQDPISMTTISHNFSTAKVFPWKLGATHYVMSMLPLLLGILNSYVRNCARVLRLLRVHVATPVLKQLSKVD